ncbi:unnamed protein product [Echinostoma caproni]|uniref:BEACH domain-containing protein n=1 Tax=Echinostoma caproni TaxID=27848 RepID=A0A3P8GDM6_9TREM|nr:unnamed protein product [Echinostoma caproni]
MIKAVEDQIQSFGQTPAQLLHTPHPHRNSALHLNPLMFSPLREEVCMVHKFYSNSPVVFLAAYTAPSTIPQPGVVSVTANRTLVLSRWNCAAAGNSTTSLHILGDDFDQSLITCSNQFTCPGDNRALIACGYDDWSFRVFAVDTGRLIQAVFGHYGIVTCLAHSGSQSANYCYLASGSGDCTVKLWIYNTRRMLVLGNHGHEAEVTAVSISSELGLVLSGSKGGTCLLHNTRGTLLRQLSTVNPTDNLHPVDVSVNGEQDLRPVTSMFGPVHFVLYHREGYLVTQQGPTQLTLSTLNGKIIHSSDLRRLAATSTYRITAVLFSACGRYLLIAGSDGVVWVLRCHNLAPVHDFPRCDAPVRSLALSSDQHYVLVGLETGSLVVFYIDFGHWHHEFQERYAA